MLTINLRLIIQKNIHELSTIFSNITKKMSLRLKTAGYLGNQGKSLLRVLRTLKVIKTTIIHIPKMISLAIN